MVVKTVNTIPLLPFFVKEKPPVIAVRLCVKVEVLLLDFILLTAHVMKVVAIY